MTDSEIVEGEFRIILGQDGNFDLFDLNTAAPCVVIADPDSYDDPDLSSTIGSLNPGNRIIATLEDTGETESNAVFDSPVYRFTDIDIQDRTRVYSGFGSVPIVGAAERLVTKLTKQGAGIGRATINGEDGPIGRVVAFNRDHPSPAEPVFEEELQELTEYGNPPFAVYQTATQDGRFFVHYYLADPDCRLANALQETYDGDTLT